MPKRMDRYEAPSFCGNCAYDGPVTPIVGKPVWSELCPVCQAGHVMPATAPIALAWREAHTDA